MTLFVQSRRETVCRGAGVGRFALVLGIIALVVWMRTLPLSLPIVDDQAARMVRRQIGARLAAEGALEPSGAGRRVEIERRLEEWIDSNRPQFEQLRRDEAERRKAELRYEAEDGREHVYLGDFDSYAWLRHARNYLRSGTTCDAVVDGECRDSHTHAPLGRRDRYHRSLHIAAIVGLHRLIAAFRPGHPLAASSFFVPVIVGALGALPAFAIGRRLAGPLGGAVAAVVIGINAIFLQRSLGSDNDVWNVVLPLFMVWALSKALDTSRRRRFAFVLCAAGVAGLHAATWSGWLFTYGVALCGLLIHGLAHGLRCIVQERSLSLRNAHDVRSSVTIGIALYSLGGVLAAVAGAGWSGLELPFTVLRDRAGSVDDVDSKAAIMLWPDNFATVSELSSPDLSLIAASMGGPFLFFVSWLGLLLLLLPGGRWRAGHFAVLIGGNVLYRYLLTASGLQQSTLIALLALPIIGAVVLEVFAAGESRRTGGGLEWIVVVWFLAALSPAYSGLRFVMLLVPPFGIAFAVAVGRLHSWLGMLDSAPSRLRLGRAALLLATAAVLVMPLGQGYRAAAGYVPQMNDAWWDTLESIREQSPPDAIVNTWWDYGYWTKYVAERRVSADGGSLATHIPHWLARVFLAPSERESIGLLRMLNCGSDATPEPEGRQGAYGMLIASGLDARQAYLDVVDLSRLDREAARLYLARRGLDEPTQTEILRATHCTPPSSYLVLTTELNRAWGWRHLGNWDFAKAYLVQRSMPLAEAVAVPELVTQFGLEESDARALYAAAAELRSVAERKAFVGDAAGYVHAGWISCRRTEAALLCPFGAPLDRHGTVLEAFEYDFDRPANSRARLADREAAVPSPREESPELIVSARDGGMEEAWIPSPTVPGLAFLVDVPNARVLAGPPYLIRSTFTHLMYLDGRYAELFEKFEDRVTRAGERVATWRIRWEESDTPGRQARE